MKDQTDPEKINRAAAVAAARAAAVAAAEIAAADRAVRTANAAYTAGPRKVK